MKSRLLPLWLALSLLLPLLLSSCGNEPATPTPTAVFVEIDPTDTAEPATPTAAPTDTPPPTATTAPTNTPAPTAEPTATAEPTPERRAAPAFEPADCEFTEPLGYDVTCGYVTLPESHAEPENGRTVRLHVAIFASDSPNPAPDPIVYLEGGPGGDALETVPLAFADRFAPFLANHDFIMFDQRGTGYSQPSLACPEYVDLSYETLEQSLTADEEIDLTVDVLAACQERLVEEGVNLAAYNSAENAADVAALRVALGYDEWNLYGISYGTRLAQTVLRDDPEGVRSVILDSAYPLDASLVTEIVPNADRAFDTFFAGCAADAACSTAYPNLEATFFNLVDTLNETPIVVPVSNLFTGEQYDAPIAGDDLIGILFQSLYSAEIIPVLPQLISEVAAGETQPLGLLLSSFLLQLEFISPGMQYSVQCNEEVIFSQPGDGQAAAAEFPEIGDAFAVGATVDDAVCAFWGAGAAEAVENEPVSSDVPTLVMAGEYDPITPPAWGAQVAAGLSDAYLFEFPGLGHGVTVSGAGCPQQMMLDFLADPTTAPDAGCIADMTAPNFVTGDEDTADVTLVPFTSDLGFAEVSGVVPEGWEEAGPGVFARGRTALDQTLILQQVIPGATPDLVLGLLGGQLGLEGDFESSGTYEAENRTWTLYETEVQGMLVDIATAEADGAAYVVILFSNPGEREGLVTAVFHPALEAVTLAP